MYNIIIIKFLNPKIKLYIKLNSGIYNIFYKYKEVYMHLKKNLACLLVFAQLAGCAHQAPSSHSDMNSYEELSEKPKGINKKMATGAATITGLTLITALSLYGLLYLVGSGLAKGAAGQAGGRGG